MNAPEEPRNPLRREEDAFRVLMMIVGAGALVVAVTLLTRPLVGAIVGLVLIVIGAVRAWGLIQEWRRVDSDPAER